jgi:predicted GNAT superfamily acetyltransferase
MEVGLGTAAGVRDDAEACARRAAGACHITVADLHDRTEQQAAADLLCRIWGARSPDQLINVATIRALAHSGNYVVGAYRAGQLIAASVAFLGLDDQRTGHLHSHITGVDRTGQSAGVGYALKQHQRAWSLARGIPAVRWTYDPLVRRNAYFNLHKLGASAREYLPDFYGAMDDGVNTGDTTDRLYISWELTSPAAIAAARGHVSDVDPRATGAAVLLDRVDDEPVARPAAGATLLVAMPTDIEALRARDLGAGLRWRRAVREALGSAFTKGYAVRDVTRDGYYVLGVPE